MASCTKLASGSWRVQVRHKSRYVSESFRRREDARRWATETKEFSRFVRKANLGSAELIEAAKAVAVGQWDADLGGGVFKQRIAREGGGKSGGFRTIILFKVGGHSSFVYGFAKNEKANITPKELKALKKLAAAYLALDAEGLKKASTAGEIAEVRNDGEDGEKD